MASHFRIGHAVEYTDRPIATRTREHIPRHLFGWLFFIHPSGEQVTVETEDGTLITLPVAAIRFVSPPDADVSNHPEAPGVSEDGEPLVRYHATMFRRLYWPEFQGLPANVSYIDVPLSKAAEISRRQLDTSQPLYTSTAKRASTSGGRESDNSERISASASSSAPVV